MGLPLFQLSFLFLCSTSFITAQQNACQQVTFQQSGLRTKWFGPECKYLCHCKDNADCDINGYCPTGCAIGWFGPACQYADMMQDSSLQLNDSVRQTTDNNNDTCADSPLQIRWNETFFFTWMRVIVGINESNKDLNISFAANSVQTGCPSLKNVIIDDKTLDIFCPTGQLIQQIVITGPGIKLCSIYVSEGRNIALKQFTFQTSTIGILDSSKAVDGNDGKTWYDLSCVETNVGDTTPTWTVEFSLNVFAVYRFKVYNRNDCCQERLSGFNIDVFNSSKTKVYSFSDQPPTKANVYTIQPGSELIISSVTITATQPYENTTVLNICEVEIFGDSHCSKDLQTGTYKYGRDCDYFCQCSVPGETCFVSTGNCPSGCKAGFYGEGCNTACNPTVYGVDCMNRCNDTCKDQLCDSVNGHCIHCAAPGKRPPLCMDDCNHGSYGDDCTMNCSKNCMKGNCHVTNGTCFDCVPGFYGTYCNTSCSSKCENQFCDRHSGHCKSCSPGLYGINCNILCPDNCRETGCDFLSGNCTICKDGFQGFRCEEECTSNTYGEKCALNCNIHCNNSLDPMRTCKNTDGSCLHGCISGFHGSNCNIATSPSDNAGDYDRGFVSGVGVGIGVTVAAGIIIFIVVYFCTKRFKNQPATQIETTDRCYDRVDPIQQNEHPYYTVDKSGDGYDLVQDVVYFNKKTNSVITEASKES